MRVSDDGVGMDESVAAQAFVPFFSARHAAGSTGLGLSVSVGLVESHIGTITIESPGPRDDRREQSADRGRRGARSAAASGPMVHA